MYIFPIRTISRISRKRRLKWAITTLAVYGAAHAIVDAACAALVLSHLSSGRVETGYFALLIIIYNALAFMTQPLIGLISDRFKISYTFAAIGCVLAAISALLYEYPMISVVIAGLGNAFFHVGGGIISLNVFRHKASAPGMFVAPGALGLLVGTVIGVSGSYVSPTFMFLLLCSGVGILLLKQPKIVYSTSSELRFEPYHLIMLLLLCSISIRGIVGFVVNFSWGSNKLLIICLTIAIVLGKGIGGILGDKFGWRRITMVGLLLSAPLIAFGNYPLAGILGMFLFNLTMPIILTAVANLLPGYPGFAFGMNSLALVTGVFITYFSIGSFLSNDWIVFGIILFSAVMLNKSLGLYLGDSEKVKIKELNIKI